jgi:hypothetical protein
MGSIVKIDFIKQPGGTLTPASDMELEKMGRFKTGGQYEVEIKMVRNPLFHRKVFAFFQFCFHHWKCDREFLSETKQFDVFRSHLTVLAGYYDEFYGIKGDVRIEAKSLSFSSMSQEDFEECYNALIQAAMKHIFIESDENTYNQLLSFF